MSVTAGELLRSGEELAGDAEEEANRRLGVVGLYLAAAEAAIDLLQREVPRYRRDSRHSLRGQHSKLVQAVTEQDPQLGAIFKRLLDGNTLARYRHEEDFSREETLTLADDAQALVKRIEERLAKR